MRQTAAICLNTKKLLPLGQRAGALSLIELKLAGSLLKIMTARWLLTTLHQKR